MRLAARFALLVLGSAIYWAVAACVILLSGFALPGDCGTQGTAQGVRECLIEVRIVMVVVFAIAALLYAIGIRRLARRS